MHADLIETLTTTKSQTIDSSSDINNISKDENENSNLKLNNNNGDENVVNCVDEKMFFMHRSMSVR